MPIPDLTHLQFLVLAAIGPSERPGKFIREKLAEEGQRKSLPAFYQMMGRLEDAKFVTASSRKVEAAGQTVTERWYKLTGAGVRARNEALDFYGRLGLGQGEGVAHGQG